MNFTDHPHLSDIYNSLAAQMVLQGSVQSMKSEMGIIDMFAACSLGLAVFFVLPKYEARNVFVQNRIDKCISMVPRYKSLQMDGAFDNVAMKQFGPGVVKFVGSNVVSDFREFPADMMFVDELDDCDQLNISYATDRMRASKYQFRRFTANPTIEGHGINGHLKKSQHKIWNVLCTCGEGNPLDFFEVVVQTKFDKDGAPCDFTLMDSSWKRGQVLNPICPFCGDPFDRFSEGLWVPTNPDSPIDGWQLSTLQSKFNSLAEIFETFESAVGDPAALQHFYTSILGIPYSGWGTRLTKATLQQAAGAYEFVTFPTFGYVDVHKKVECSMGVDVGKFFDVRISEIVGTGERVAVYVGKATTVEEVINLGIRFNVQCAVMDNGPETKLAEQFQEEAPFYVWLCRYHQTEGTAGGIKKDKKLRKLQVDRTTILDKTLSEIKLGRNILPANFDKLIDGEYVDEMTVSVRESVTDSNGNIRYVWTKGKDHARHADVYDYLASRLMGAGEVTLDVDIL
jgi:hypothetical protein